jgi:SAM-dependent methyltransferase
MDSELKEVLRTEKLHHEKGDSGAPFFIGYRQKRTEENKTESLFYTEFAEIPQNIDSVKKESEDFKLFLEKTGFSPDLMEVSEKTILDAGCGAGRFAKFVAPKAQTLIALDAGDHIQLCRKNLSEYNNCVFVQADIKDMPIKDNCLDIIYSIGVIHHTGDMPVCMKEFYRILKPGGYLLVWVYPPEYYGNILQKAAFFAFRFFLKYLSIKSKLHLTQKVLFPLGRLQMKLASNAFLKTVFSPLFLIRIPRHEDTNEMKATIMDYFMPPFIEVSTDLRLKKLSEAAGFEYHMLPIPTSAKCIKPMR